MFIQPSPYPPPRPHLDGINRDLSGVAGAGCVSHNQDQVRLGDEGDGEGALAVALVTVAEDALEWPAERELLLLQLVEEDLLVTGRWLCLESSESSLSGVGGN